MFHIINFCVYLFAFNWYILCACHRTKRVIGGQDVPCGTQLRVASLRNSSNSRHICGATILTYKHAITAAHCVFYEADNYFIQLDNYCSTTEVPTSPVININKHYLYTSSDVHDIAVLQIKLNFSYIASFKANVLPNTSFGLSGKCTIYGYGYKDVEDKGKVSLQAADVKVISLDECTAALGPFVAPDAEGGMVCAMGDGTDACQGDSGGPLVCSDYIEGLSSYGLGCNVQGKPGVYVSIGAHLTWLKSLCEEN